MPTYKLKPFAENDLIRIENRIAVDSPLRALNFIDDLTAHFDRLASLRVKHQTIPEFGPAIRRAVHGNYNIFYRIDHDGVIIVRVLAGKTNLSQIVMD